MQEGLIRFFVGRLNEYGELSGVKLIVDLHVTYADLEGNFLGCLVHLEVDHGKREISITDQRY